jgi:hypothetical protein
VQVIVGNDGGGTIFDALEVAEVASPAAMARVLYTPQEVAVAELAAAYGWGVRARTRTELDQALTSAPSGVSSSRWHSRGDLGIPQDGGMTAKSQTRWTGEPAELLRVGRVPARRRRPRRHSRLRRRQEAGQADLADGVDELDDLQERLYAQSRVVDGSPSVLLVLQAMDSAGKGGIVRHVIGRSIRRACARGAPPRSARTTSCGASRRRPRRPVSSACSTGRTTRTS